METTLHRQLKDLYAQEGSQREVRLGPYRIDVVNGPVKPIVVEKYLVKRAGKGGPVTSRRLSPKRGRLLDLFDDLVHFTRVFPHRRLVLEVPLVDVEEWRYPGHGRRRRWRRSDHQIEDQKLLGVREVHRLRTARDVGALVGCPLPQPFHTGDLAVSLGVERWIAQQIAYCLRKMGSIEEVGKMRAARLYRFRRSNGNGDP
jgi:hypothetical protein